MSGLVVFSTDVRRLAHFYECVLDAEPTIEASGDIRLRNDLDEVLIHSIPGKIAARIVISTPPAPRQDSPMKPVFEVRSLSKALEQVVENGGVVTGRTFRVEEITRHDVLDPDGNVIQLRSHSEEPS